LNDGAAALLIRMLRKPTSLIKTAKILLPSCGVVAIMGIDLATRKVSEQDTSNSWFVG
jgi:hypothetical protein